MPQLDSEVSGLSLYLRDKFCREWDFKQEDNRLTLTRDIGDNKETIRITRNDMWDVTVKIIDRQRELFTQASYNAHHDTKLSEALAPTLDRCLNDAMQHYLTKPPSCAGHFHHGILVEKERCDINKPHYHFYVTQYVTIRLDDIDMIDKFLDLRYRFFITG